MIVTSVGKAVISGWIAGYTSDVSWPPKLNVPDGSSWVMNTTASSSEGSTQNVVDAAPPHMNEPAEPTVPGRSRALGHRDRETEAVAGEADLAVAHRQGEIGHVAVAGQVVGGHQLDRLARRARAARRAPPPASIVQNRR